MSFITLHENNSNDETRSQSEKIKKIIDDAGAFQWLSRVNLPSNKSSTDFSVWNFVKQCIGKDLTRISMPVTLNEPISFLQRMAENLEYSELLREATKLADPVRRMEYICAFAVSTTSSNFNRMGKPFNPLLGETYELHRDGFVFVSEQVSHHPPITAFHAESPDFRLWATVQFRIRFWGKSIEVQPKGEVTLELLRPWYERYTWHNPNIVVHNVLFGKLWLEHVGNMPVIGRSTGLQADLEFHQSSWLFSQVPANQVTGTLISTTGNQQHAGKNSIERTTSLLKNTTSAFDQGSSNSKGSRLRVFFGNWTRGLFSVDPSVWNERPKCSDLSQVTGTNRKSEEIRPDATSSPTGNASDSTNPQTPTDIPELGFERPLANQHRLWLARSRSPGSVNQYNFTSFTITLNELTSALMNAKVSGTSSSYLPPTDSRFRPDIRALENGDLDLASSEKNRLEEKQRYVRRLSSQQHHRRSSDGSHRAQSVHKSAGASCSSASLSSASPTSSPAVRTGPLWFKQRQPDDDWVFTGRYWQRDWSKCPDLY